MSVNKHADETGWRRTEGHEVRLIKSITIVVAIVVLFSCSGLGVNPGEASVSEKRIQELIKQLDGRTWDRAVKELVRIGEPAVEPLLRALNQNSQWISARASIPLSKKNLIPLFRLSLGASSAFQQPITLPKSFPCFFLRSSSTRSIHACMLPDYYLIRFAYIHMQ